MKTTIQIRIMLIMMALALLASPAFAQYPPLVNTLCHVMLRSRWPEVLLQQTSRIGQRSRS
jgi:hypothetical protein